MPVKNRRSQVSRCAIEWLVATLFLVSVSIAEAQSLADARELVEARRFHAATAALTALVDAQSLAQAELAQAYYLRGESQRQRNRFAEARADFQRALELDPNLALAAFGLGLAERYGWGSSPNPARARDLLRQAADAGIAQAAMELGLSYLSTPPVDEQQGLAALEEAANAGHRDAAFTLGELNRLGQIVRADPQQAFRWYRQAADLGHAAAMFHVAMAYRDGSGVAADAALADTWLQRSLAQGHNEALHLVGFEFESQGDLVQANQHYWRAAQAGLMRAQINLGVSYMTGNRGVQQDVDKAYYWFNRAAGAGLADYYRGRLLEHGRGIEANIPAAFAAYEAAARSVPEALAHVALLLDLGRGVSADPERAATYFAEFANYESAFDLNSVAWALATHPAANASHGKLALELATRAATIAPDPSIMDTLAAAHATNGDFAQAVAVQQQAMQAVDDAATLAEFETHLAKYRAGERWVDAVPVLASDVDMTLYPDETVTFTGEVINLVQGAAGNAANSLDLEPRNSEWGVVVRVGRVEQGALPQHLQDIAVFYLHSPTQLFARLPGNASFMSPPEGEHRFTLTMRDLDFDLEMAAIASP